MTIKIATISFFVFSMLLTGCRTLPVPRNGIDVEFPNKSKESEANSTSKLPFKLPPPKTEDLKEVKIGGMLAYHIAWQLQKPVKKDVFDKIKPGLTLKQIITLLGPGYQPFCEGVGLIYWNCEDGRKLNVLPEKYQLNEKPRYWIKVKGVNQCHDIIKNLAHDLIAGIIIEDKRVLIVCTKDTYQAKAGKAKYYKTGDWFQETEELPRIDFKIKQINSKSILCKYYYRTLPKGIIHYSETGTIIIKPKANKVAAP